MLLRTVVTVLQHSMLIIIINVIASIIISSISMIIMIVIAVAITVTLPNQESIAEAHRP